MRNLPQEVPLRRERIPQQPFVVPLTLTVTAHQAINIINLPTNLEKEVTHRYSANSFKLHRLPIPRPNQVLGLVGTNGIGKSTALKVLAGKLKPNLGRFDVSVSADNSLNKTDGRASFQGPS